jgi:DNA-directed RNA polymerase subunit E'/Rpb7
MKDIIRKSLKTKEIHINPNDIRSTIGNAIDMKIKKDLEGMCCEDGYIIKDSINIVERSMGKIINVNNQSKIMYNIKYTSSIISPAKGVKLDCYINSVTKMGAVAYIKYDKITDFKDSPLLIIIPKTYSPEADQLELNKKYKIEVMATRLKYKANQIHIVAKLV